MNDLNKAAQILEILPGAERWFVEQALGRRGAPPTFASYAEALAAYLEAKSAKDLARLDSILRALIRLASTFEEAWAAHELTSRDSLTWTVSFIRAVHLAKQAEQLQLLYYNSDRNSLLDAIIVRQAAKLLSDRAEAA